MIEPMGRESASSMTRQEVSRAAWPSKGLESLILIEQARMRFKHWPASQPFKLSFPVFEAS